MHFVVHICSNPEDRKIEEQKLYKDQNNALQTFRKDLIPVFEETFSKPCATVIVRKEKLTSNNYI